MALELSMVMGMLAIVAPCLIVLGNAMRQHVVMEKVAYQSARQLATMPRQQMSRYASYQQARTLLEAQAMAALAAAGVDMSEPTFEAGCLTGSCGSVNPPQQVRVKITTMLYPTKWGAATGWLLGSGGLELQAVVVLRYEN
ncbi:hypothetical protein D3C86_1758020 [compost metagenome]